MVVANGFTCIILTAYTLSKVKLYFNLSMLRKVIVFSLPMIPAGILIFILNMGDRFLLGRLSDFEEVGIYALGYKFGMLLGVFFGSPFLTMWAPKRMEVFQRMTSSNEFYSRILLYFALVLSFGGLLISLVIRDLLILLATPEFLPAYRIVPFVILGYAFYNLYYILDFGFYVHKKTYWYSIINGTAAAINVGLNLIIIPKYGALGAAIVTAISFSICPVFAYLVSQRYHRIRYDFTRISQIVGFTLLFYFLGNLISIDDVYISFLVRFLLAVSFPVLLYLIGFFDAKEMEFIRTKCLARLGFAK
jgi:O-antigen/teichoic acid export membrane protein